MLGGAMSKIPKSFQKFVEANPEVGKAYKALGTAVSQAGPLDARTRQLVKVGIAIGARMEGAVHSHVRKALEAGATPDEIRHAAMQATTTVGFPTMMAGLSWVDDVLEAGSE